MAEGLLEVARAIDARDGKINLPADLWHAIDISPFLGAAQGEDTSGLARRELKAMAKDPDLSPLATVLRRILSGDRNPALAAPFDDHTFNAIVTTVLHHIS
jgi:hypothetical protein